MADPPKAKGFWRDLAIFRKAKNGGEAGIPLHISVNRDPEKNPFRGPFFLFPKNENFRPFG
jgi:hypothetical protein